MKELVESSSTAAAQPFWVAATQPHYLNQAVVAPTPCAWRYAHLGEHLSPCDRAGHPYGGWVRAYSSSDLEALARTLESPLDDLAPDEPTVHDAYRYALNCELDFFSAPPETAA